MSKGKTSGWLLVGMVLTMGVLISCGGEADRGPAPEAKKAEKAQQDQGASFAQIAALAESEAHEARSGTATAKKPVEKPPLDPLAAAMKNPLTELPGDFPPSIGDYPGMTVESMHGDQGAVSVTFTVEEPLSGLQSKLSQRLQQGGWTVSSSVEGDEGGVVGAEKGEQSLELILMSRGEQTTWVAVALRPK